MSFGGKKHLKILFLLHGLTELEICHSIISQRCLSALNYIERHALNMS